jgi:hypothetical protein
MFVQRKKYALSFIYGKRIENTNILSIKIFVIAGVNSDWIRFYFSGMFLALFDRRFFRDAGKWLQ